MKSFIFLGVMCLNFSFTFSHEFTQSIGSDSKLSEEHKVIDSDLIDIQTVMPGVNIDLRYAKADNFTGQIVYNFSKCLLLKEAAFRLQEAQEEFESLGLKIKIWDGYRPIPAQRKFWELVPDERYVSDPKKGGRHTRGTAIDLTLLTNDGKELPMPSVFDEFSDKAHRNYMGASSEEIFNRELLQTVMEKHGFHGLPTEWWHFDLVGWENHPPLDVDPGLY